MKRKYSYKIKGFDLFMILLGFCLALYDMNALKSGIQSVLPIQPTQAMLVAIAIALVANSFALSWGMTNGKNKAKHVFNKKSFLGFFGWAAFAVVYIAIEIAAAINPAEGETFNLLQHIPEYVILATSYIFSGLMIQSASREIWDADASACRSSESEFNLLRKRIAKDDSKINYMLTALENYNQNYDSLNEQYDKQLDAIRHAEDSVINEILGKTLQDNPEVTPSEARKVVEEAKQDFIK